MTDQDSIEPVLNALTQFYQACSTNPEFGGQFASLLRNTELQARAPRTWQAQLEDMIKANVVFDEKTVEFILENPEIMNAILHGNFEEVRADADLVHSSTFAKEAFDLCINALDGQPSPEVVETFRYYQDQKPGVLPEIMGLHPSNPPELFEEKMQLIRRFMHSIITHLYQEQLAFLLRMSSLYLEKPQKIPHELGPIMNQCRNLWKSLRPEMLCLLNENFRVVRNSEAHKHTVMDVRAETVTFINKRDGAEKVLGPLTGIEVAELLQRLTATCFGMLSGIRLARFVYQSGMMRKSPLVDTTSACGYSHGETPGLQSKLGDHH